jgi:hypothetical protein
MPIFKVWLTLILSCQLPDRSRRRRYRMAAWQSQEMLGRATRKAQQYDDQQ